MAHLPLTGVSSPMVDEYNAELERIAAKQERNDRFCMDIAHRVAQQSYALRSKVGAVMVKGDNILAVGYNGTPAGWNNVCERMHDGNMVTSPDVLHAESNDSKDVSLYAVI